MYVKLCTFIVINYDDDIDDTDPVVFSVYSYLYNKKKGKKVSRIGHAMNDNSV